MAAFDLGKPGKFKVVIGKSLKTEDADDLSDGLTNIRFNTKSLVPGDKGVSAGVITNDEDGKYALQLKDAEDDMIANYIGSQRPGRKLECVLIYSPETNSFVLEKLSSAFTFNREYPETEEAELTSHAKADSSDAHSWKVEDPLISDAEETAADVENPFDVRHFLQKHKDESEEEEDEEDEDDSEEDVKSDLESEFEKNFKDDIPQVIESVPTPGADKAETPIPAVNVISTAAPKPLPKKRAPRKAANPFMPPEKTRPKLGGKSPMPGASPLPPSAASLLSRPVYDPRDSSMSPSSQLPSPAHQPPRSLNQHMKTKESESESDVDESDEDSSEDESHLKPKTAESYRPTAMSREHSGTGSILSNRNEPDILVIDAPKNQAVGNDESDEDADNEDEDRDLLDELERNFDSGDDAIVIEGDDSSAPKIGLGINVGAGGPITLGSITGSRRRDESEESSSEEE